MMKTMLVAMSLVVGGNAVAKELKADSEKNPDYLVRKKSDRPA